MRRGEGEGAEEEEGEEEDGEGEKGGGGGGGEGEEGGGRGGRLSFISSCNPPVTMSFITEQPSLYVLCPIGTHTLYVPYVMFMCSIWR